MFLPVILIKVEILLLSERKSIIEYISRLVDYDMDYTYGRRSDFSPY